MTHEELNDIYKKFAQKSAQEIQGPLGKMQKQSLELFLAQAIPHRKHEDWLYTTISKGLPEAPVTSPGFSAEKPVLPFQDVSGVVVFAGGKLCPELTELPEGMHLETSAPQALSESFERLNVPSNNDSFEALNLLSQTNWAHLTVQKGTQHTKPLYVCFTQAPENENEISQARLSVTVESGAELSVYEVHEDAQAETKSCSNDVLSFELKPNAQVQHVKATYLNKTSTHIGKTKASLERDARFETLSFSLGGKLVRHNVRLDLYEEGAHAEALGLYALQVDQHADHFVQLHHHAPHSTSDQLYKGILADESRGVFTGKVVVERHAQKVDSAQLNKNLILGKKAHADTRPQLEVYADDVKCAHGATVGQIDEDEIFYLQSRGLGYQEAQFLLCHAFGAETLQKVKSPQLLAELTRRLEEDFESQALEEAQL